MVVVVVWGGRDGMQNGLYSGHGSKNAKVFEFSNIQWERNR